MVLGLNGNVMFIKCDSLDKKVTTGLHKNEIQEKLLKEVAAQCSKVRMLIGHLIKKKTC